MLGPKAIGPSRFWMSGGSVPEPNEDTQRLYEAYTYLPHTYALRKWTKDEDSDLQQLILRTVQVSSPSQACNNVAPSLLWH